MMEGFLRRIRGRELLFIFIAGFSIHLWQIGMDLPNNYNTDEPHHINKAAHFGTGDLNPHDFKYPSLWSYVLAGMLGTIFVVGRILGIVASTADFAQKYVYDMGFFIFCGRVLSVFFLSLIPLLFFRLCDRYYDRRMAWACAFLALISSSMTDFGLQAVPYSLLVFFACCALFPLHEILEGAGTGTGAYARLGFFIGLSTSTHYVAAPFGILLVVSFIQERSWSNKVRCFAIGLAAAAFGFFLGTPYLLLDAREAMPHFIEHYQIEKIGGSSFLNVDKFRFLGDNLLRFVDHFGLGFALALIGIWDQMKRRRRHVLMLCLPLLSAMPIFIITFYGVVERYTVLLAMPLLIFVGAGFLVVLDRFGRTKGVRAAIIATLSIVFSISYVLNRRYLTLPDTRTIAEKWVQQNVPEGAKILLPGPFEGPPLLMTRKQVERLYERTRELKHPREVYFRTLLAGHPGGGYEIFYLKKSIDEVMDLPSRTARAFQAQDQIDVENGGVKALLDNGVTYVVIRKEWENQEKHQRWIAELRSKFNLVAAFITEPKKTKGVDLEIYKYVSAGKEPK